MRSGMVLGNFDFIGVPESTFEYQKVPKSTVLFFRLLLSRAGMERKGAKTVQASTGQYRPGKKFFCKFCVDCSPAFPSGSEMENGVWKMEKAEAWRVSNLNWFALQYSKVFLSIFWYG